jgi:glutaredoxin
MKTILLLLSFTILLASLPATTRAESAAPAKQVDLYVTDWCGYCRKAEAFLKSHNIPYTRYNVEEDSAANERKFKLGGGRGVPFAMIDGHPVQGFSQPAYEALLGMEK